MPYECEQTVAKTCESITNKANGLRFLLLFFFTFFENACERPANTCEYLQMLENDIQTLRLCCKCLANS